MACKLKEALDECFKNDDFQGARKAVDEALKNHKFTELIEVLESLTAKASLSDMLKSLSQKSSSDHGDKDCDCTTCKLSKKAKKSSLVIACNDGVGFLSFPCEGAIAIEACFTQVSKVDIGLKELQNPDNLEKILEGIK